MTKRFLIFWAFVAAVLFAMLSLVPATAAHGLTSRAPMVTVVWSPHPDDETLRLTGYTSYARVQGDILILVAVTDGGASAVKDRLGISSEVMMEMRRQEQSEAWSVLTAGEGRTIRLGLPDGAVTIPAVEAAYNKVNDLAKLNGLPVEHYVAATSTDVHPDHKAVALGVLKRASLTNTVVRFSLEPGVVGNGMPYISADEERVEAAHQAYDQIGMLSVPHMFQALHDNDHYSRVTVPVKTPINTYTRHTRPPIRPSYPLPTVAPAL